MLIIIRMIKVYVYTAILAAKHVTKMDVLLVKILLMSFTQIQLP